MINETKYFIYDTPRENSIGYYWRIFRRRVYIIFIKIFMYIVSCIKNNDLKYKYNVVVCAIFKNESKYIKEWIEFHKIIGIEHFYLYNNNSDDDFNLILRTYIDEGLVTLIDWPYNQGQMGAYQDCINNYRNQARWIGFIDLDEFVVPVKYNNVYDFLKLYNNWGSVLIYWKIFGSNGMICRDMSRLVTEDFYMAWPKHCDIGKCFYNTSFELDVNSKSYKVFHHMLVTNYFGMSIPPINVFGNIALDVIYDANSNFFPIQINHYAVKSYCEYRMKKNKGDVYFKISPHDDQYFDHQNSRATYTDFSAYKYLIRLKQKLGSDFEC